MAQIQVDFNEKLGKIKPMHAVNNGPSGNVKGFQTGWGGTVKTLDNMEEYQAAGIPFARTHDASFYSRYGLEHTVDVANIFPNFDADPYDPASYDFVCTDHYMDMIESVDTKVFYRLGHRIEHEVKKYGTLPPKDFKKWAIICEHIIRHMTEGWADGAKRDILYWEIWNEPDLDPDEAENKRTWGGTKQEFFEFYHVVATHLKECFPHLKIGGPAISGRIAWAEEFISQLKAPLDFFSWHVYAHTVEKIVDKADKIRAILDQNGFTETESILNEWNYVLAWHGDDMAYSHLMQRSIKGASFTLAAMIACQKGSVDMLMYYDARPCNWNGIFDLVQIGKVTTTAYFTFPMFNTLYRLGREVESVSDDGEVHVLAARGEEEGAVVLTNFNDDDNAEGKTVSVDFKGLFGESGTEIECYVLEKDSELTLVQRMIAYGDRFTWEAALPNFNCYLFKLKKK